MPPKRKDTGNCWSDQLKRQKGHWTISEQDIKDVEDFFNKHFEYKSVSWLPANSPDGSDTSANVEDWIGENPVLTEQVSPDPELMALKQEVNDTKDLLSSKDIEIWHDHTTKCNLAVKVIPFVKQLHGELCTQAWVKFHEIVSSFPIVPDSSFLSLHLCEAPGAFVTSLNHFLKQNAFKHQWYWRATTLNPYYESNVMGEMIADDRLIRHTYSQWFFGRDGSGDIMAKNHVKDLYTLVQTVQKDEELPLLLVTADGSKDCQINPAEQEACLTCLHYCEMISACLVLAEGGSLVLKLFTMFEPQTVALIFLLNVMFSQVHIKKPATSKSGNSEIYVVCLKYHRNIQEETLWKLLDLMVYSKSPGSLEFTRALPLEFLKEHRLCCQYFANLQMETIKSNLRLFEDFKPEDQNQLYKLQNLTLKKFREQTRISKILIDQCIIQSYGEHSHFTVSMVSGSKPSQLRHKFHYKNLRGTFDVRQTQVGMSWQQRIQQMTPRDNPQPHMVLQSRGAIEDNEVADLLEINLGSCVSAIDNSRLCPVDLMKDLNLLLRNVDLDRCRRPLLTQHVAHMSQLLVETLADLTRHTLTSHGRDNTTIFWVDHRNPAHSPLFQLFMSSRPAVAEVKYIWTPADFNSLSGSQLPHIQVVCNVTSLSDGIDGNSDNSECEELKTRLLFLKCVSNLLKCLPRCSRLVIITSSFLSRLTAGILYILAGSFQTTSVLAAANMWMHQFVVLDNLMPVSQALLNFLPEADRYLAEHENGDAREERSSIMEIVTFTSLLNDKNFVRFVTSCNNFVVTGFVNEMIKHLKAEKLHQEGAMGTS